MVTSARVSPAQACDDAAGEDEWKQNVWRAKHPHHFTFAPRVWGRHRALVAISCCAQRSALLLGAALEGVDAAGTSASPTKGGASKAPHLLRQIFMAVPFFLCAGLDQRERFSNTSFAKGIAENTLGHPT